MNNEQIKSIKKSIEILLDMLSGEERLEVFRMYCASCGVKDPKCQCWNDE